MEIAKHQPLAIRVNLDIEPRRFAQRIASWDALGALRPPANLAYFWNEEIHANLEPQVLAGQIKQVKCSLAHPSDRFFRSAAELAAAGHLETWWHDVIIDLTHDRCVVAESIFPPTHMEWHFWAFGKTEKRRLKITPKIMKGRARYRVTIYHAIIPAEIVLATIEPSMLEGS